MTLKNVFAICMLSVLFLTLVAVTPVQAKASESCNLNNAQEIEESITGANEKLVMPDGPIDRERINH